MQSRPQVIWLLVGEEPSGNAFDGVTHSPSLAEAIETALQPRAGFDPWLRQDGHTFDRHGILSIREAAPAMQSIINADRA